MGQAVEAHEGDAAIINCLPCGATADEDVEGQVWVACRACAEWSHAACVGRWTERQCDLDYVCSRCFAIERQSKRRLTGKPGKKKPCTPRCRKGCVDGTGCVDGYRLTLTLNNRLKIKQLVIDEGKFDSDFYATPGLPGEIAVHEPPDGGSAVKCTVLAWEFEPLWARIAFKRPASQQLLQQEVHLSTLIRFAPRYSGEKMDELAATCGCDFFNPPRKQLRFEMRALRKDLKLRLAMTPGEYLSMTRAPEAGEEGGAAEADVEVPGGAL